MLIAGIATGGVRGGAILVTTIATIDKSSTLRDEMEVPGDGLPVEVKGSTSGVLPWFDDYLTWVVGDLLRSVLRIAGTSIGARLPCFC